MGEVPEEACKAEYKDYIEVKDNKAAAEKLEKENAISAKLSNKWYYNICPNCGAYPSQVLKHCDHCGASLEVDSFENGTQSSVHKISLKE